MAFKYIITSSVVVLLAKCVVNGSSSPKLFILKEQGQKLNHVVLTTAADSTNSCCGKCSIEDACVAVSYNSKDGICTLNDRNPFDFPYFSSSLDSAWTTYEREVKCPGPGWVPYHRACYKSTGAWMTWVTAQNYCASIGGHLVDILDETETQFVIAVANAEAQRHGYWIIYYWIGLRVVGSTHGWVSGSPYSYRKWSPGSPSYVDGYGTPENCVHAGSPSGMWNDVTCSTPMPISVCKKKVY